MRKGAIGNWIWRGVAVFASLVALFLALRVLQSERQPDLKPWHMWAPREADSEEIDALDWAGWMALENHLMDRVRERMHEKLEAEDRVAANRYFEGSPLNAAHF